MGDMNMNKMQAIWSFLGDMLEKDPAKYKSFIEEQMAEAKKYGTNTTVDNGNTAGDNFGSDGDFMSALSSFTNLGISGNGGASPSTKKFESPTKIGEKKNESDEKEETEFKLKEKDELFDIVIPVASAPTRPKPGKSVGPLIQLIDDDIDENAELGQSE